MTSTKIAVPSLLLASLGRSTQQIQLSLIPFPEPSADPAEKARAFNYCRQALETNKDKFEFNEFSAFLTQHIPGSCNAALHQVTGFGTALRSAFFEVNNLRGECFFYSDGTQVEEAEFNLPPHERPADISIFSVKVAVNPANYTPEGVSITDNQVMHMTYWLSLPQDTVYTLTGQPTAQGFSTPKKKRALADITGDMAGPDAWADVGLPHGKDVLEDYELDLLILLPANK
jgi:hypothetical protein